jgi:hypothetical protein
MTSHPAIQIVGANGDRIVIRRTSPNLQDGWFDTDLEIHCDGWRGQFKACFMHGELGDFARELRILHEKLAGKVALVPVEPNLEITFTGDGKGRISVDGIARNHFHTGTRLSFHFDIDQTFLPGLIRGLEEIEQISRNSEKSNADPSFPPASMP